ncbi:hypothetical protein AB5I41_15475 [Sphingomonas sp. MMS24-JH45]
MFTTDTYSALRARFPDMQVDVVTDDHPGRYEYPAAVVAAIPQNDRAAYVEAGRAIAESGAQALWVEHEYGIDGGEAGSTSWRAPSIAPVFR